jgi:hypothetical protein
MVVGWDVNLCKFGTQNLVGVQCNVTAMAEICMRWKTVGFGHKLNGGDENDCKATSTQFGWLLGQELSNWY